MTLCWFAQTGGEGPSIDTGRVAALLRAVPGLSDGLIHTPGSTHDPYLHDGAPPRLALQCYFETIEALEAAVAPYGPLRDLPALIGDDVTQQAMLTRRFAVPDPVFRGDGAFTYLVAYEGKAEDLPAWLAHYIASHAAIMTRFPAIRAVEIFTRIDWCGGLAPWRRVDHMQRNKVVFDDAAALTAALNSPVRHEMRADFGHFPPFTGPVSHFPMQTVSVKA